MTEVNHDKKPKFLCRDPLIPYEYAEARTLNTLERRGFAKALEHRGYTAIKFSVDMPRLIEARENDKLYYMNGIGIKAVELIDKWIEDWKVAHSSPLSSLQIPLPEFDTTQIMYYIRQAEEHQKNLQYCLNQIKKVMGVYD